MKQQEPIENIEIELRHLIHDVLSKKFGQNWIGVLGAGLGEAWVAAIEQKINEDKSARGNQTIYDLPIFYSEFSDLRKLIVQHKDLFELVFDKWDSLIIYLKTAEGLRNAIKHHRDISPTQEYLLAGIAGEITDSISLWRIGTKAHLKRIQITFNDNVATAGKSDGEILKESEGRIATIANHITQALIRCGLEQDGSATKNTRFYHKAAFKQVAIEIETPDRPTATSRVDGIDYKKITTRLHYNAGCRVDLDRIVREIDKQYWIIEYLLKGNIDIDALKSWSLKQAGLSPGSSVRMNGASTNIEYKLLGGKLRVVASNYQDNKGAINGKLTLINESAENNWYPHTTITAHHLLGFMLGNISPRAIMHLHMQSMEVD